jgi:hypothetical protein
MGAVRQNLFVGEEVWLNGPVVFQGVVFVSVLFLLCVKWNSFGGDKVLPVLHLLMLEVIGLEHDRSLGRWGKWFRLLLNDNRRGLWLSLEP